jgi:hypothetical protein
MWFNILYYQNFLTCFQKSYLDYHKRELEFIIELKLGIEAIPKAPYHMTIPELRVADASPRIVRLGIYSF